jgi:hypothetical protein
MPRFEMENNKRNLLNFSYWVNSSYCTLYCSHCDKEFEGNMNIIDQITSIVGLNGFTIGQVETNNGMRAVKC